MLKDIDYYNQHAVTEAERFDSVTTEQAHQSWKSYWPIAGQTLFDIGAGSGRDAYYFQQLGVNVLAVEPANNLLQIASSKTSNVIWRNDKLPALSSIHTTADVILVSAVWMFLSKEDRKASFKRLNDLLNADGKLIISYKSAEISYQDMIFDSKDSGLYCISCSGSKSSIDNKTQFATMVYVKEPQETSSIFDTLFSN